MSPLRSFSRSRWVFRCWHLLSTNLVLPGARAQVGATTEPHGVPVSPLQAPQQSPRGWAPVWSADKRRHQSEPGAGAQPGDLGDWSLP